MYPSGSKESECSGDARYLARDGFGGSTPPTGPMNDTETSRQVLEGVEKLVKQVEHLFRIDKETQMTGETPVVVWCIEQEAWLDRLGDPVKDLEKAQLFNSLTDLFTFGVRYCTSDREYKVQPATLEVSTHIHLTGDRV